MTHPNTREAAIYLAPALVLAASVILAPLGYIVYFSLHADSGAVGLGSYASLARSGLFWHSLATTMRISAAGAVLTTLVGYPVALHLSQLTPRARSLCLILVLVPFWTSILVKSYAFTVILGRHGIVNSMLAWMFGPSVHLALIFNDVGVMIAMTNYLIPFVVFPVLASLLAIDRSIYRAAEVIGATPWQILRKVTLPLSMPGVLSGLVSTFVMSTGFFVIPALLGGRKDMMLANLVEFFTSQVLQWNEASAIAVVLLGIVTLGAGLAMQARTRTAVARTH